jgi:hypothetical protein
LLYKFLPVEFAERFVRNGEVLFRTLSYFRALEHAARGDEAEGVHIDAPDNDVTLTTNTGIRTVGRYRYLRSVRQDDIFAFCCSTEFSEDLFDAFNADACVAIRNAELFLLRCKIAVRRPLPLEPPGLLHGPVSYFALNRDAPLDVTVGANIPFLKHARFADQKEYRAVFARRGGFHMTNRIVQPQFAFAEEIAASRKYQRLIRIGDLRTFATVVHRA